MSVLEAAVGGPPAWRHCLYRLLERDAVAELMRILMVALLLLPASWAPLRAMLAAEPARHPAG
jgi:hypothetical protein